MGNPSNNSEQRTLSDQIAEAHSTTKSMPLNVEPKGEEDLSVRPVNVSRQYAQNSHITNGNGLNLTFSNPNGKNTPG